MSLPGPKAEHCSVFPAAREDKKKCGVIEMAGKRLQIVPREVCKQRAHKRGESIRAMLGCDVRVAGGRTVAGGM